MDFTKSIFENSRRMPLVCAHRGSSSGNIPCNTIAAFSAALMQGADMIELDVAISADGNYYVFHPGMEHAHLKSQIPIRDLKSEEVERLRYHNPDDTVTQFGVISLAEAFDFLRGKCYINVDKFRTDIPGISRLIRECGVQDQVVVKTGTGEEDLEKIRAYASDLMFMPVIRGSDSVTDRLTSEGINCIGAEVLFKTLDEPCCSPEYIKGMHEKGRVLFVNSEVYDYSVVISACLTDDLSVAQSPDLGWGRLTDMGFDIIQTDWAGLLKNYLISKRANGNK